MLKVTKKIMINPALWIMECPFCGDILASASEKAYLPEFSTCDCIETEALFKAEECLEIVNKGLSEGWNSEEIREAIASSERLDEISKPARDKAIDILNTKFKLSMAYLEY